MTNILMVEDNELNRDMLSRRLKRKDFEVACALDGESGVEMARAQKPDLILMDMSLPGMDGFQFVDQLRIRDQLDVPIIVVTAKDITDEDRSLLNGAVEQVVSKSEFDRKKLEQLITELANQTLR